MIKNASDTDKITIDVYLKDGESFLGCDIPEDFMGENLGGGFVTFWWYNNLRIYPAGLIHHVILHFDTTDTDEN